jgi:hypothetical protein
MSDAQIILPRRRGAGRPKGARNKSTRQIKQLAQGYGAEVIEGLMEIFRDVNQPANFRIMAADQVLDRGLGKATQDHKLESASYDLSRLNDEQLRTTYELLKRARRRSRPESAKSSASHRGQCRIARGRPPSPGPQPARRPRSDIFRSGRAPAGSAIAAGRARCAQPCESRPLDLMEPLRPGRGCVALGWGGIHSRSGAFG